MAQGFKARVPAGDIPWKVRLRVCTWYSQLLGKTAAETARDFLRIFGGDAIKEPAVKSLFRQFRQGRNEMCDLPRSGRPKVRTAAKVAEVKQIVKEKPKSGIFQVACKAGISCSSARTILKKDLKLKKRAAKMVPHALTDVQKVTRVALSAQFLQNCECTGWLSRVITADECWFYAVNPNSKVENIGLASSWD